MQLVGTAKVITVVAVAALFAGVLLGYASMVAVAFGILLWLGIESTWFLLVVSFHCRHATIERRVSDRTESVKTLWEGKKYNVETRILFSDRLVGAGFRSLRIDLTDVYPTTFGIVDGSYRTVGPPCSDSVNSDLKNSIHLRYRCEARELGVARFHGIRARFTSPSGLFTLSPMLRGSDDFTVAPRVFQTESAYPLLKQDNRISPPGIHAHRRAGSGSELLGIREYLPGDPPKSIAWKLTARRDQLMCKQFESEVPLRCTLFMDTSASTYLRANQPPVIQPFVRVASTLIEFLTASRDPIGVVTFDATSYQLHKHSAARRTSLRTIRSLTNTVTDVPKINRAASNISQMIRLGLALSQEIYPELYAASGRGFGLQILPTLKMRRARTRRRYRMAAILCGYYGPPAHTLGDLLYDDSSLVGWLQKFLLDHQWGLGESRSALDLENIADPRKVTNLIRLLRHAVARSQDQERYVILADLLHVADYLSPLASVIRTAQAHGHRVSVVCALDEFELPEVDSPTHGDLPKATRKNAHELFSATQSTFLNRRFQQLQREMARAQVRVVGVHESTMMQQVLVQLQMARPGRIAP